MLTYRFSEFILVPAKRTLSQNGTEIRLRDKEFDLLVYLIENALTPCSVDQIIAAVWGGTIVENNSVEKAVVSLRSALGDDAKNPRFIKTIRTKGYLFVDDIEIADDAVPLKRSGNVDQGPTLSRPRTEGWRAKPVFWFLFAFVLMSGLAMLGWKGKDVWSNLNKKVILADEFSRPEIDPERWTVLGNSVRIENGVAKLRVEETDKWGRLHSAYFSFERDKPIIITSRIKVTYSQNLKDRVYFHGYFGLTPKTSVVEDSDIKNTIFFGIKYANYDYESKLPDGNIDEQRTEGFFLVKSGGDPGRRLDYEQGRVSARIKPVWDEWFDQTIVYDPMIGDMKYYINGELRGAMNAGPFTTDLPENMLRLEINPEGWWLYHSIELDSVEVYQ